MSKLKTELSGITPGLSKKEDKIRAWFTLKNPDYGMLNDIPGLNLGFNTPEKKEVIVENRIRLLSALDLDQKWVAYADQVHSNRVQIVTQGGTYPNTDGLVTVVPGLTLAIQVADCAAVLLWEPDSEIVGALHAGWRGAAGSIVPKGVDKMIEQGANPQKMKAFVSPCISLKNFEVGTEVAEQFPDEYVDYKQFEKPHIDLPAFLRYQLQSKGVKAKNIETSQVCTVEDEQRFYSYRREGKQSGRMMAVIQISESLKG